MQRIAARAAQMPPFLVMEVLDRATTLARQGRSIIHLAAGEPDFPTPAVAIQAAERAIHAGRTHYTPSLGHPELREALSAWYAAEYGVRVPAERFVITLGSSAALLLVCAALLDPGDEVILTDPHYACYPQFVTSFHGVPVRVPVREADAFQYDPADVARALSPRTRALLLNSPANPTGTLTAPERLQALAKLCRGRATIISDEIYHGLVYAGRAHTILEFEPDAVVVSGFSKRFAMTGWRLGYAILPDWLIRPVQKLQQNLFISPPDFAQFAAVAALESAEPDVARMRTAYDQRRRLVLSRLRAMALPTLSEPVGAFYVFVNVSRFTDDVHRFAFDMLEQVGVATTPGVDFGPGGAGYLRISYASATDQLEEGLTRVAGFLATCRAE